ncbi:Testis-expressed sequence 10 protein [Morella rubra]|uniref:Testis-expressed sequence 10 protein n=1 Tax=Morella rubra TaxID=262757 RepID=A0A6A1V3U9_9ROSI|nr:Testis-expressed sequence 10 protein [Morella rubra]
MKRSKASTKKQQKRGVDFKKIKRKIGRKLPPPKNSTNTEIKSKAIILPEQSVASEKEGLAVNKKGLTLKELLQQTSHHNSKVRRDALIGIKDLFLKHPTELRLHKYAVIEKLRERIGDDDKVVREALYQLFKSVIFPSCKEDNQGLFISLIMAYVFNAMTHLTIDIRLMAFKFLDLVVQNYPPCFISYAEKILQSYEDILRKNQFYLQDKGKLKNVLSGLVRCLLLVPCNDREADSCEKVMLHAFEPNLLTGSSRFPLIIKKLKDVLPVLVNCFQDLIPLVHTMPLLDAQSFDCLMGILQSIEIIVRSFIYGSGKGKSEYELPHGGPNFPVGGGTISSLLMKKLLVVFPLNPTRQLSEKDDDRYFILNILITRILLQFSEWICPPSVVLEKFLEFIENALLRKICSGTRFGRAIWETNMLSLLPFLPKLISQVARNWSFRLLQAFTKIFKDCHPESSLKMACLSTIEDMLIPKGGVCLDSSDPEILDHQIAWIRELTPLLILLGDKHPPCSQVVLRLQLRLGQCALVNSAFEGEYEIMQYSLVEFYGTFQDDGNICYGPFVTLPRDSQELSLSCLYYFANLDSPLLKSIASCCLSHDLEPFILFRIVEVLHSAYAAGHIRITDHICFFTILLSSFKVFPETIDPVSENDTKITNRGTFKSVTSVVCANLLQIGDSSLVFEILEKITFGQVLLKPSLDNACAMLRMLAVMDCKPSRLSEQSIITLSTFLPGYLIDVVQRIPEIHDKPTSVPALRYYLLPCFLLFDRSRKLLALVLKTMGSLITESSSLLFSPKHIQLSTDCSSRINAIVSILVLMHKEVKVQKIISSHKADVDHMLQKILSLQSSEETSMTIEEKHKLHCAFEQLKVLTSTSTSGVPAI